jgi:hypothetical protein
MITFFSFLIIFPYLYNFYFWNPLSRWGSDQRFENKSDLELNIEFEILRRIQINMLKTYLLEKLMDNTTNELIKMKIIETEYEPYCNMIRNKPILIPNITTDLLDKYFF